VPGRRIRHPLAVAALVAVLAGCGPANGPRAPAASSSVATTSSTGTAPTTTAPTSTAPQSVTVLAGGDVLIHQDLELTAGARQPDGGYDFSGVLAPVAPIVRAADLAICHLETPVAPPGGPYRGYPSFAVQPQIVTALAGAGFDVCSTASNHTLDDGFSGVVRTLDTLDAAGIRHSGSYRTQAESQTPTILDVHGVRVAEVAGTYGLNGGGPPAAQPWAVDVEHVPDVTGLLAAAHRARAAGAQVVIVSLHCCVEYQHDPTAAQVQAVHALLASPDVDLVIGHHAHVVQPFENVGGKWVAYGLGNFVAEMAREGDPYDEVLGRFTFTRGPDGRFAVTKAEAIPLHLEVDPGSARVVPADAAAFARVSAVVDARGAQAAGLQVVHG
jgi:poly-gamma-glutamate capsule biosynthesis protein CapA/YwtB (metallophosphatase superfamily)